tara:strand:+ start:20471 stop:20692 length:222 start_codon:yes stop_codon:yes gene_type:complete
MRRTDSAMDTSELSRASIIPHERIVKDALDLRVLSVRSGSGLNELNFALVRYRQDSPDAPLRVELRKVRSTIP